MSENAKGVVLSQDDWKKVIEWAESHNNPVYIFILRCLANQQVVTAHAINAFKGLVIQDREFVKSANKFIGEITHKVKTVMGIPSSEPHEERASWYNWNTIRKEWTTGWSQTRNLRAAFGATGDPWKGDGEH